MGSEAYMVGMDKFMILTVALRLCRISLFLGDHIIQVKVFSMYLQLFCKLLNVSEFLKNVHENITE